MDEVRTSEAIRQGVESGLKRFDGIPLPASCLALGVHKGGSTMLHNFLRLYIRNLDSAWRPKSINISTILFRDLGLTDQQFDDLNVLPRIINENHGRCYYGWRQVPFSFLRWKAKLSNLPAVSLIRDPRDCAVSAYFSFLKTHKLPKDESSPAALKILEERKKSANKDIDEWVIQNISRFTGELARMAAFMHPRLRLFKYENIYGYKQAFFREVIDHLNLPHCEKAFVAAFEATDIQPGKDPSGHVRKGTPGDHREKLNEETQAYVNTKYQDILELFDYL